MVHGARRRRHAVTREICVTAAYIRTTSSSGGLETKPVVPYM